MGEHWKIFRTRSDIIKKTADNRGGWSIRMTVLLRALILVGYPLAGIIVSFAGVGSATITYPYRGLIAALSVLVLLLTIFRRNNGRIDVLLVVFFAIYAARLSYDWAFRDLRGAKDALLFFLAVVALPVFAATYAYSSKLYEDKLAKYAVWIGSAVLILVIIAQKMGLSYNPWADVGAETNRLMFEALNPISLGNLAGIVIICSIYILIEGRSLGNVYYMFSFISIGLGCYAVLYANSRGPIVAIGVALGWFLIVSFKRMAYAAPLFLIAFYFIAPDDPLIAQVIERFGGDAGANSSNAERIVSQTRAIDAFLDNPALGAHFIDPLLGAGNYPHNLIIETAMSLGLLGLMVFLIMHLRAGYNVIKFLGKEHPLLAMLFIQQFIASSLSGALWAADAFFLLLSLCQTARPQSFARTPSRRQLLSR